MKILLVYGTLISPGGIETLILRMVRYLSEKGHKVSLILTHQKKAVKDVPGSLAEEVARYADVWYATGDFRTIGPALKKLPLVGYDTIYCLQNSAYLIGLLIHTEHLPDARLVAGTYFPREYCWHSRGKRFQQQLLEDVFRKIPTENVFFMTPSSATDHGECLGRDFSSSPLFPLPVDVTRFSRANRRPDRRKIVSIGRITIFKTYNFQMVDIIRDLNLAGHAFDYHVYGDGLDYEKLQEYITHREASQFIHLHGMLPYDQMENVLENAFLFVGMGTALMEAAACGVPSLIAVESNPAPTCYGYVHESRGISVGEFVRDQRMFPLKDKILELTQLDGPAYNLASDQSAARAGEFSVETVMDQFVEDLGNVKQFSYPITRRMRIWDVLDLWRWRILKRIGYEDPLVTRLIRKDIPCA